MATFFQRNGIADDRREAVAKRLLSVLVSWKTVDEGELAWGKEVLRVGFDMPEKFTLNYDETSGSAVGPDQSIKGVYHVGKDEQGYHFQLMLDSGILVDHGREWHTKRGHPPEA